MEWLQVAVPAAAEVLLAGLCVGAWRIRKRRGWLYAGVLGQALAGLVGLAGGAKQAPGMWWLGQLTIAYMVLYVWQRSGARETMNPARHARVSGAEYWPPRTIREG